MIYEHVDCALCSVGCEQWGCEQLGCEQWGCEMQGCELWGCKSVILLVRDSKL